MTNLKLTMLAAAAIGAATIGGASAMPLSGLAGQTDGLVHQARVVCNQYGTCWDTRNTRRTWRSNQQHYVYQPHYGQSRYGHRAPRAGITIGPFGIYAR